MHEYVDCRMLSYHCGLGACHKMYIAIRRQNLEMHSFINEQCEETSISTLGRAGCLSRGSRHVMRGLKPRAHDALHEHRV